MVNGSQQVLMNVLDRQGLYGENELHDSISLVPEDRRLLFSQVEGPEAEKKRRQRGDKQSQGLLYSTFRNESDPENGGNGEQDEGFPEVKSHGDGDDSRNIFQKKDSGDSQEPEEGGINKSHKLFQNEHLDEENGTPRDGLGTPGDSKSPHFGNFADAGGPDIYFRDSFGVLTREKDDVVNKKDTSLMKLLGKPVKPGDNLGFEPIEEEVDYIEARNGLKQKVSGQVKDKIEGILDRKLVGEEGDDLQKDIDRECETELEKMERELGGRGQVSARDISSLRSIDLDEMADRVLHNLEDKIETLKNQGERTQEADLGLGKSEVDRSTHLMSQKSFEAVSGREVNKSGQGKEDREEGEKIQKANPKVGESLFESKVDDMASGLLAKMGEDVQGDIMESQVNNNMASQMLADLKEEVGAEMEQSWVKKQKDEQEKDGNKDLGDRESDSGADLGNQTDDGNASKQNNKDIEGVNQESGDQLDKEPVDDEDIAGVNKDSNAQLDKEPVDDKDIGDVNQKSVDQLDKDPQNDEDIGEINQKSDDQDDKKPKSDDHDDKLSDAQANESEKQQNDENNKVKLAEGLGDLEDENGQVLNKESEKLSENEDNKQKIDDPANMDKKENEESENTQKSKDEKVEIDDDQANEGIDKDQKKQESLEKEKEKEMNTNENLEDPNIKDKSQEPNSEEIKEKTQENDTFKKKDPNQSQEADQIDDSKPENEFETPSEANEKGSVNDQKDSLKNSDFSKISLASKQSTPKDQNENKDDQKIKSSDDFENTNSQESPIDNTKTLNDSDKKDISKKLNDGDNENDEKNKNDSINEKFDENKSANSSKSGKDNNGDENKLNLDQKNSKINDPNDKNQQKLENDQNQEDKDDSIQKNEESLKNSKVDNQNKKNKSGDVSTISNDGNKTDNDSKFEKIDNSFENDEPEDQNDSPNEEEKSTTLNPKAATDNNLDTIKNQEDTTSPENTLNENLANPKNNQKNGDNLEEDEGEGANKKEDSPDHSKRNSDDREDKPDDEKNEDNQEKESPNNGNSGSPGGNDDEDEDKNPKKPRTDPEDEKDAQKKAKKNKKGKKDENDTGIPGQQALNTPGNSKPALTASPRKQADIIMDPQDARPKQSDSNFVIQEKPEVVDSTEIHLPKEPALESSKGPKKGESDEEEREVASGEMLGNPNQQVFEYVGDEEGDTDKDDESEEAPEEVDNPFEKVGDSPIHKKTKSGGKDEASGSDFASDFEENSGRKKVPVNPNKKFREESEEDILEAKPDPKPSSTRKSILKDRVPFLEDKKKPKSGRAPKKRVSFSVNDGTLQAKEIGDVLGGMDSNKPGGSDPRVSSLREKPGSGFDLPKEKISEIPKNTNFDLGDFEPKKTANISLMEAYGEESGDTGNEEDPYRRKKHNTRINRNNYEDSSDSDDQLYFLKGKSEAPEETGGRSVGDVLSSKRFVVLAAVFFFLFFASVFLWIVLFGFLNSTNMELGAIVIENPTLGDYYQIYDEFYLTYDKNRDKMNQMNKELDISANEDYKQYKQLMNNILNQRFKSEDGINKMRAKMFELQKAVSKRRLRRRILEKSKSQLDDGREKLGQAITDILHAKKEDIEGIKDRYLMTTGEANPVELARELLAMVNNQMGMYDQLIKATKMVQESKAEINDFFERISRKIIDLYRSSFDLIQLYGKFYLITERIWVTCDNIFR